MVNARLWFQNFLFLKEERQKGYLKKQGVEGYRLFLIHDWFWSKWHKQWECSHKVLKVIISPSGHEVFSFSSSHWGKKKKKKAKKLMLLKIRWFHMSGLEIVFSKAPVTEEVSRIDRNWNSANLGLQHLAMEGARSRRGCNNFFFFFK